MAPDKIIRTGQAKVSKSQCLALSKIEIFDNFSFIYASRFRMHFLHSVTFLKSLSWFVAAKVSSLKTQRLAENTCANGM